MHLGDFKTFSTVMFPIIYSLRPRKDAKRVTRFLLMQKSIDELLELIERIEFELAHPSMEVRHCLPLACDPSEEEVREFLRLVSLHLRSHLKPTETGVLCAGL
ncbi:MAG: hypothetical protein HS116_06600 [Planctomycetes bacterium]|nr:hypothetical protein [Planctomycetota bacterium]